jgi:hypothetical protein
MFSGNSSAAVHNLLGALEKREVKAWKKQQTSEKFTKIRISFNTLSLRIYLLSSGEEVFAEYLRAYMQSSVSKP